MDTLIDNREFPAEMHEKPTQPASPEKSSWWGIFFVVLALLVLGFLVYAIFFNKPANSPADTSIEKRRQEVMQIQNSNPQANEQLRNEAINNFFNS